jgi:hypothetical protein
MTLTRHAFAARVRLLAATLGDLKDRVRTAVAAETGKAVADAVRDVLTAALGGRPAAPPAYGRATPPRDWDDDDDPDDWDNRDGRFVSPPAAIPRWPTAVALAAAAARGWAARRLPGWAAAAVGLLAGAAAAIGSPLLTAGLAAAGAVAGLVPHLDLFPQRTPA